jgi:S1-C subfamily serine protease
MSITPANMPTWLLLVLLCLSGAGCVRLNTTAERDASFSPYNGAKVGEESLWNYLIYRSGILVGAESVDVTSTSEYTSHFNSTNSYYGTAAAIDERGYFLTAGHCLEKGHVWLAFLRDGKLQMERARVVWRGNEKKREPDLAVLCVSHPIGPVFQWAAAFTNGSPVVDVGLRLEDDSHHSQPQLMAGRVLKVSEALSADSLGYTVVSHSSPLRPGDSGGPLVLSDGRLLGINFFVRTDFQWNHLSFEQHSEAHRPDLVWLRKVIDADAALFPREISSP